VPLTPESQRPAFILIWIGLFTAGIGFTGIKLTDGEEGGSSEAVQAAEIGPVVNTSPAEIPGSGQASLGLAPVTPISLGSALETVQADLENAPMQEAPIEAANKPVILLEGESAGQPHHQIRSSGLSSGDGDSNEPVFTSHWFDLAEHFAVQDEDEEFLRGKARVRLERWRNGLFMARIWLDDHSFADLHQNPEVVSKLFEEIGIDSNDDLAQDDSANGSDDHVGSFIKAIRNRGGIAYLKALSPSQARKAFARFVRNHN